MTNTITSYIHAVGRRSDIREIKIDSFTITNGPEKHKKPFSLERWIPTPLPLVMVESTYFEDFEDDVYRRLAAETGFTSRSAWRKHNWGVSEDVTDVFERKIDTIYWMFKFYSVQAPPLEAIRQLSARYPRVEFNIRFFGVAEMIAGDMFCRQGQLYKKDIYQGATYNDLLTRLNRKGVVICNEKQQLRLKYNYKFSGAALDDFSLIFGVNFD